MSLVPFTLPFPADTRETRRQLHDAIRACSDEALVLRLVTEGADPRVVDDGENAYSLARRYGYSAHFCQQIDDAFAIWLAPLTEVLVVRVAAGAEKLLETLREHGWRAWCQYSTQIGAFVWLNNYRLWYGDWAIDVAERLIYARTEVVLGLPTALADTICALLEGYGVCWVVGGEMEGDFDE